jgi:hypothetical protein
MPLQTPALWQSLFDLSSEVRLLRINDRFPRRPFDMVHSAS